MKNWHKESIVARRKGHGTITKVEDVSAVFNEVPHYVLTDKDGQFVDRDISFNRLHSILWK